LRLLSIVLICILSCTIVNAALIDNIVSYYPFENLLIDSVVTSGYNLTNSGTLNTTGKVGSSARSSAGSVKYMTPPQPSFNSYNWSVTAWVMWGTTINTGTNQHTIIDTGAAARVKWRSDPSFPLGVYDGTAVRNSNFTPALDLEWHHVALTGNSSGMYKIYVDSVLRMATVGTARVLDPLSIGIANDLTSDIFNGSMDEFGLWNRTLLIADIQELYNSGAGLAYPFVTAKIPDIQPTSYNHSTAINSANETIWRTSTVTPSTTHDDTPTISFQTDVQAYCRINSSNQNWTQMGDYANCTTTGTINHVCSLGAYYPLELNTLSQGIYLSCVDTSRAYGNLSTSSSGLLNISLDLWSLQGYVKNAAGTGLNGAVVVALNQSQQGNNKFDNTTTNSSGAYQINVWTGNYTVYAYNSTNITLAAAIKNWIVVP